MYQLGIGTGAATATSDRGETGGSITKEIRNRGMATKLTFVLASAEASAPRTWASSIGVVGWR